MSLITQAGNAERLQRDFANYLQWLQQDSEQRSAAYDAVNDATKTVRIPRVTGHIAVINTDSVDLIYTPVKVIPASITGANGTNGVALANTLRNLLSNYHKPTLAGSEKTLTGVKGFIPAKLILKARNSLSTSKTSSRKTKRKYYKHDTDSVSMPFGKNVAADTFQDIKDAVSAIQAYTDHVGTTGSAAYWRQEGGAVG